MADPREMPPGSTVKKKVDESWKNNVEKEKSAPGPAVKSSDESEPANGPALEPSFSSLITSLGVQAFMALGEFPDSTATGQTPTVNLVQAKSLIDVLEILSEKTKGNLTKEEAAMLQEMLYGLQMKFVKKSGKL
ncbi:MAG: hypothetical protein COT00_01605 [Candidatus Omnitrophica bacterium CG07_land_8_20_14_0_80_50_8]|nr:MAG: hypothetical protein COT00_01605 [Candidatus Omnitrophica bacterium CG07_land_8_20_14_0_80_50_8]